MGEAASWWIKENFSLFVEILMISLTLKKGLHFLQCLCLVRCIFLLAS